MRLRISGQRVVDAVLAFPRERRKQREHRQQEQERRRLAVRREGDEDAERREQHVDGVRRRNRLQLAGEADPDDRAGDEIGRREVERQL